jgi:regulator of sigma E protease
MVTLPQPTLALTVATFAVVIGVLVFIHEFGHYLAGRIFGVKADAFSIGFGREIAGWTDRRGTRWKVGILPLGGYVKFAGDMNAASEAADVSEATPAERAVMFQSKPLWQRTIIILAGPLTNFIFAIAVFAAFFMIYGHAFTPAVVATVVADSPAAHAGFVIGDRIVALDGVPVERFEDVIRVVTMNTGAAIDAEVNRRGQKLRLTVQPRMVDEVDRFGNRYKQGRLGIGSGGRIVVRRAPVAAVGYAVKEVWLLTGTMADGIVEVVSGRRPVSELGGPIKIAQISGQQAVLGLPNVVQFMALISINLGFINLLPVPMLDGGHLFLYAVEAVRRRPLAPKVQELAFMSGFAALLSLMVFLTWNDLAAVGVWQHLARLFG